METPKKQKIEDNNLEILKQEHEKWQNQKDIDIRTPFGWLSIIGLFWLSEKSKVYSVGSEQDSDILLPKRFPKKIATLRTNDQNQIEMKLIEGINDLEITIDKEKLQPNTPYILKDDEDPKPTNVNLERTCIFFVIKRKRGLGIRIKDAESDNRKNFGHRIWFPYDPNWVISCKWVPDEMMLNVPFANELGEKSECKSLGYAEFEFEGKTIQFRPIMDGEKLQFIFKIKQVANLHMDVDLFLLTSQLEMK